MQLIKSKDSFVEVVNNLIDNNEVFNLHYTGGKLLINCKSDGLKYGYYLNKLKSFKDFHFIKKVAKYIEVNDINFEQNFKISYMGFNPFFKKNKTLTKDVYELDLSAAYWTLAYKYEFISKEIYEEGLKVDKIIRLIALGSLAKNEKIFFFNGTKYEKVLNHKNERAGIFFKLSYETDKIMKDLIYLIGLDSYLFYWVDAIFFRGIDNAEKIKGHLKGIGVGFKLIKIKKLRMNAKKNKIILLKDGKKKESEYFFKNEINLKNIKLYD